MAIKQRVLMKLDTTKNHILRAMNTGSKEALIEACQDLTKTRNMYREGLPQHDYIEYDDICGGLILAVRKMVENGETSFRQEELSLCQELLQYLKNQTEKESRFKKEIVFLPYNSSMWDSLESVWKAAYEDKEHCNAYVMPIPYCERNPDTSAFEWHCEREKFPKYVPTLDWKEIDLEAMHPDVIFFHNPFDNQNHVTSVDSRYYSSNLKNITDKLVYIPYAVEEEIQPGDEAVETAIEHRVLCPGIINAHLVIAQSEDMRQAWINILMRRTNVKDRAYWEKHILGLGSPKIDKVLTSKREDFEMPEKWIKLIKGKKVILYITSISPTLQYSDKVCEKLRYVFDVFRNRDDVVLWWRPHPLMKATFHSMRPQYEEEYLSIETQYIEEGWGIYDDSSDLHRAICYSDAYYGDMSSVMTMYSRGKKPIMIQELPKNSNKKLYFMNLIIEGINAYTLDYLRGILYQINFHNKQMIFLGQVPKEFLTEKVLYGEYGLVCKIKNRLLLLPVHSTHVLAYDFEEKRFSCVCDIHHDYMGGKEGTFFQMITCGNFRYFMGYYCSRILKYDVETEKYSYLDEWYFFLRQYLTGTEQNYESERVLNILGWSCKQGDSLFLPTPQANVIIEISLVTNETQLHVVGKRNNRYGAVDFDGQDYWILSWDEPKIIQWRYGEKEVKEYWVSDMKKEGYKGNPCYSSIHCHGDCVYLYPGYLEVLTIFNKRTKKIEHIPNTSKYFCGELENGKKVFTMDEEIKGKLSFSLNSRTNFEEWCFSREDFTNKFQSICLFKNGKTEENRYISLQDYCNKIHSQAFVNSVNDFNQKFSKCGEGIYQEIIR